jgi:4-hydroxythreonine-4-phosphate dehydrogenase
MSVTDRSLPILALTMGDLAGIGPEIIAMALQDSAIFQDCRIVVVGDSTAMSRACAILGCDLRLVPIRSLIPKELHGPGHYFLAVSTLSESDIAFSHPSPAAAAATVDFIRQAVEAATTGSVAALCTAPINKSALQRHGFPFPGHTEFLQNLTGSRHTVMMLVNRTLRVSLVTIHCALVEVPSLLSIDLIDETITITHQALVRDFGISQPRLAVAGLNPHAGEGGLFGDEEQRLIAPAVSRCQERGIGVKGPLSPDTVFYQAHHGDYDAVVCMYHDQGLIPFKLLHFRDGVNVTLGLPIIRTSVDHGTAYDLAGTGKASPASLLKALRLAASMAKRRENRPAPTA